MTEQQTLVEFLAARLDEDEAAAHAATAGPWRYNPSKHYHRPNSSEFEESVFAGPPGSESVSIALTGETDDRQSMADAAYIARFDPARVLREVAAKRAILELHDGMHECSTYRAPGDIDNCSWCIDAEDCSTIQALAAVYSDHEAYREKWRP